jgi:hypothetical protein
LSRSTDRNIRYTKEHLAKAKEKGRTAFAVGFYGGDRGEAFMWLEDETATLLWLFAHQLNQGKAPREALDHVEGYIADWKAKKAAKAAEIGGAA